MALFHQPPIYQDTTECDTELQLEIQKFYFHLLFLYFNIWQRKQIFPISDSSIHRLILPKLLLVEFKTISRQKIILIKWLLIC